LKLPRFPQSRKHAACRSAQLGAPTDSLFVVTGARQVFLAKETERKEMWQSRRFAWTTSERA